MRNCTALAVRMVNLEGAIIHLEEHKTLHTIAGYQAALKLLQDELAAAEKAYRACMGWG